MHLTKLRETNFAGVELACGIASCCLVFALTTHSISGAPAENRRSPVNVRELLQDVARNEEKSRQNPKNYFRFILQETTPNGSETSIRIETPRGKVGRVISVNGKEPSPDRCRADSSSVKKLLQDPQAKKKWVREQSEETNRTKKLVSAVPDAFIFQYAGREKDTGWIRVSFRPDPRFRPRSYETALLTGIRGTLWVDPMSRRLAKIDGTLVKNVKFGWGFLASIHRGGHFVMQQSRITGGSWRRTFLQVDLDGTKLLFGQLHVHLKEWSRSFVPLPDHTTWAQAVGMLEHTPATCRKNHIERAASRALNH